MPDIHPFRAYRYNLPSGKLPRAVCPPYDIIGDEQARRLRASPYNAVHVELPEGENASRYKRARNVWDGWKKRGIVCRDLRPAFYVYEQAFRSEGKTHSRRGFFCELEVEEPGKGSVLAHELTLSKPKEDRLNLVRALQVNSSPIFGLFQDKDGAVREALEEADGARPLAHFRDADRVTHRLWGLTDGKAVGLIRDSLEKIPVLIADGHHRYETAWNYSREDRSGPAKSALFFLCPMEDPGLVIYPTHRVLKEAASLQDVAEKVARHGKIFNIQPVPVPKQPPRPSQFVLTDGKKALAVRPADPDSLEDKFPGKPDAYSGLSLAILHAIVLPDMQKEDFIYSHDLKETLRTAKSNKSVAVLLPPTTKEELYGIVRAGQIMPQKSTYFYPKVITGLVFRSLEP